MSRPFGRQAQPICRKGACPSPPDTCLLRRGVRHSVKGVAGEVTCFLEPAIAQSAITEYTGTALSSSCCVGGVRIYCGRERRFAFVRTCPHVFPDGDAPARRPEHRRAAMFSAVLSEARTRGTSYAERIEASHERLNPVSQYFRIRAGAGGALPRSIRRAHPRPPATRVCRRVRQSGGRRV